MFDPDSLAEEIKNKQGVIVGRGQGNHVSVEFNVLYRVSIMLHWCYFATHGSLQWHPTMSKEDEKWTVDSFNEIFHNKPFSQLTTDDFIGAFKELVHAIEPDPSKRTFAGYASPLAVTRNLFTVVVKIEAW